jgi:hypothetical protein
MSPWLMWAQLALPAPTDSWQFKEWIALWGLLIAAGVPLIGAMWYIGNKHLGGTMTIKLQEANALQTAEQMKMLNQMRAEYIPALSSNITGAEIARMFTDIQSRVADIHRDMKLLDESRLRHENNNLKMMLEFSADIRELKARA